MSVGRYVALVMVCLASLGAASEARADVSDYLGKAVVAVSVQSEGRRVTDQRVVSLIETAVGKPLAMREINHPGTLRENEAFYQNEQRLRT